MFRATGIGRAIAFDHKRRKGLSGFLALQGVSHHPGIKVAPASPLQTPPVMLSPCIVL
ncbi:hypothetical protein MBAV_000177 [Candidatus Magnetobacterium bavaricum]|uniref:Uncharacterized protein n=1 Tax=Candidatus Magnetobacterium bavaricum TaxID=29290 RepID=A0A0F3H0D6_9BACT|nr:hypothetical protein MBAV_000177 [Candidatus Magnetobacterium bavaricum]